MMHARFIAGSEHEITSIVNALQKAGYAVMQVSHNEIDLDLPEALAEEGQAAADCGARTDTETSVPPDSVDPNLPQPDDHQPETAEREFVLAPLFRHVVTSISGRCLRLHRCLHEGWSTNTRYLHGTWRMLSSKMSRGWSHTGDSFVLLAKVLL